MSGKDDIRKSEKFGTFPTESERELLFLEGDSSKACNGIFIGYGLRCVVRKGEYRTFGIHSIKHLPDYDGILKSSNNTHTADVETDAKYLWESFPFLRVFGFCILRQKQKAMGRTNQPWDKMSYVQYSNSGYGIADEEGIFLSELMKDIETVYAR